LTYSCARQTEKVITDGLCARLPLRSLPVDLARRRAAAHPARSPTTYHPNAARPAAARRMSGSADGRSIIDPVRPRPLCCCAFRRKEPARPDPRSRPHSRSAVFRSRVAPVVEPAIAPPRSTQRRLVLVRPGRACRLARRNAPAPPTPPGPRRSHAPEPVRPRKPSRHTKFFGPVGHFP